MSKEDPHPMLYVAHDFAVKIEPLIDEAIQGRNVGEQGIFFNSLASYFLAHCIGFLRHEKASVAVIKNMLESTCQSAVDMSKKCKIKEIH